MERVPTERKTAGIRIVIVLVAMIVAAAGCFLGWHRLIRSRLPVVEIETSMGIITAELQPDKAPLTVASFLGYVDKGHYDGMIFHRVISGFMIQTGSFRADYTEPETRGSIKNESRSDMPNSRGTLAMARTDDPHSATSGFYINLVDNKGLDRDPEFRKVGYCVFGVVTDGFDVVERIGNLPTGSGGPFPSDVPAEPVIIKSIRRVR